MATNDRSSNLNDLDRLVLDTIHARSMSGSGCFVANSSAYALRQHGPAVLAPIERTVIDYVLPQVASGASQRDIAQTFLGVNDLWFTYLSVGSSYEPARITQFLSSLPLSLQLSALVASQTVFRRTSRQAADLEISSALQAFFQTVADQAPDHLREFAKDLVRSFYRSS